MRVIITGATGFIGSHLAQHYLDEGHEVFITGQNNENHLDCQGKKGKCLGYNFAHLKWETLPEIDVLFHQAAITDTLVHDRNQMFRVNFEYSRRLFDQAIDHGVKKIVYASSAAVYGDNVGEFYEDQPGKCLNVYAESKLLLDRYAEILRQTKPDVSIIGLRYSNVYGTDERHKGPARSMISQLYHQMLEGNARLFKWGEQQRDFVYVKDVVRANILAAESDARGVFNVGSGAATSFNDVVALLNEVMGTSRSIDYIDSPIIRFYQNSTLLNLDKSKSEILYSPRYSIKEGIEDYIKNGHPCPHALPC